MQQLQTLRGYQPQLTRDICLIHPWNTSR